MLYRLSLLSLAAFASFALLPGYAEEPKEPEVLLSSKVATDGGFLTLNVKVGDQWRRFMVDTGANWTTFDAALVKDLPKAEKAMRALRAAFPGNKPIPDLYVAPKMIVSGSIAGELEFPDGYPVQSDNLSKPLSKARAASNLAIEGILGMDFLWKYAMELDLAAGTLRLLDSRRLPAAKHDATLDIDLPNGSPFLSVTASDVPFRALLDTGLLSTVSIERKLYDELKSRGELSQWILGEKQVDGKTGILTTGEGWLSDLKVGPFTHYYQHVTDDKDISLLGLYYWRRYRCVFDFPKRKVYLDKGPLFDVFDDSDHAGIYPTFSADGEKKKVVVAYVNKGCWADRNGVRVGDQLVQIDGRGVESDSLHIIQRRLCFHHDRTCELRLVRDGKELTIVLPASGTQPRPRTEAEPKAKERSELIYLD